MPEKKPCVNLLDLSDSSHDRFFEERHRRVTNILSPRERHFDATKWHDLLGMLLKGLLTPLYFGGVESSDLGCPVPGGYF